ncbi:hypothetical protein FA15DRAFT_661374 [Coprinopsis marcescibilis]|uniref:Uncharacterized protein n=1 Tax=Coprinopsis marcescibilis TaxID=230819 RepID=A0A5C3KCN8_COPMA|nr:hypothetical protein FA15DRAFT_661374 [Coprinopsis marcescibilis]
MANSSTLNGRTGLTIPNDIVFYIMNNLFTPIPIQASPRLSPESIQELMAEHLSYICILRVVDKRFKRLVTNNPCLWTTVILSHVKPQWLEFCLANSKGLPMRALFLPTNNNIRSDDDIDVKSIAFNYVDRFKAVNMFVDPEPTGRDPHLLRRFMNKFSEVSESLDITVWNRTSLRTYLPPLSMDGRPSTLTNLRISNAPSSLLQSLIPASFPLLVSLHLEEDHRPNVIFFDLPTILDFLRPFEGTLEHLALHGVLWFPSTHCLSQESGNKKLDLRNLKSLSLRGDMISFGLLLSFLGCKACAPSYYASTSQPHPPPKRPDIKLELGFSFDPLQTSCVQPRKFDWTSVALWRAIEAVEDTIPYHNTNYKSCSLDVDVHGVSFVLCGGHPSYRLSVDLDEMVSLGLNPSDRPDYECRDQAMSSIVGTLSKRQWKGPLSSRASHLALDAALGDSLPLTISRLVDLICSTASVKHFDLGRHTLCNTTFEAILLPLALENVECIRVDRAVLQKESECNPVWIKPRLRGIRLPERLVMFLNAQKGHRGTSKPIPVVFVHSSTDIKKDILAKIQSFSRMCLEDYGVSISATMGLSGYGDLRFPLELGS